MRLTSMTFIKPEDFPAKATASRLLAEQIAADIKSSGGKPMRYRIEEGKKGCGQGIGRALKAIVANAKVYERTTPDGQFIYVTIVSAQSGTQAKKR